MVKLQTSTEVNTDMSEQETQSQEKNSLEEEFNKTMSDLDIKIDMAYSILVEAEKLAKQVGADNLSYVDSLGFSNEYLQKINYKPYNPKEDDEKTKEIRNKIYKITNTIYAMKDLLQENSSWNSSSTNC